MGVICWWKLVGPGTIVDVKISDSSRRKLSPAADLRLFGYVCRGDKTGPSRLGRGTYGGGSNELHCFPHRDTPNTNYDN